MHGARVLVVEDSPDVRELLDAVLAGAGFDVCAAATGTDGLRAVREHDPDLVVLDLGLPDMDGTELCRRLRTGSDAYVLMLTGRSDEVDMLVGLAVGADDYMAKPFSPRELVARVRALLRRPRRIAGAPAAAVEDENAAQHVGDLLVDRGSREVRVRGEAVALTRTEFDLLAVLAQRPGRVWERQTLLREVWHSDWEPNLRLVEVHMSNLRRKLAAAGMTGAEIRTVRGVGYRLVA
ncbi:response regulator transcription factor [Pseudonocardia bannensis]|uniref:Response regulator transcription factor n=1 Tax=Pseudonocardia bannensis TaxID=630973 RepID=A0A848DQ57_9PSEU|nr:response regulator transcription factor [Pseudonocardia bannensis]